MRDGVTMSFEEALKTDSIYIDCSMYMDQIRRYLRFFSEDQFLFLFHDQLKNSLKELFMEVEKFLGIAEIDLTAEGLVMRNVSGHDDFIRAKTTVRLRKLPAIASIADIMSKKWRDWLYVNFIKKTPAGKHLKKQHYVPPMKPETRKKLIKTFEGPNRELEGFLKVSLDSWKEYQ